MKEEGIAVLEMKNYPNAYREIYEILKYVPQEDFKKIPTKIIKNIEENMNKEYDFFLDLNIDFIEKQKVLPETKLILSYIFLNYWATEQQKEIINMKFIRDIEKEEEKRRQLYNINVFENKKKKEETKMVVYKEEKPIIKVFSKIKRLFGIKF